ncbi:hypothetical protein [uncultured Rikenella sp.]|nr:hypothetical protein [uncultured Rikenella sp.]
MIHLLLDVSFLKHVDLTIVVVAIIRRIFLINFYAFLSTGLRRRSDG